MVTARPFLLECRGLVARKGYADSVTIATRDTYVEFVVCLAHNNLRWECMVHTVRP